MMADEHISNNIILAASGQQTIMLADNQLTLYRLSLIDSRRQCSASNIISVYKQHLFPHLISLTDQF